MLLYVLRFSAMSFIDQCTTCTSVVYGVREDKNYRKVLKNKGSNNDAVTESNKHRNYLPQ